MAGEDRTWAPAEKPADVLAAGAIVLRRWHSDDAAQLAAEIERSREHLARWLPWAAQGDTDTFAFLLASAAAFDARTDFGYGMWEPDGSLVGGAGLHARLGMGALEIGYWVAESRVNRGYATAAAGSLTAAAFTLAGVGRVEIHCDERNVRSAAVPRKLGYRLERIEDEEDRRMMVWVAETA